VYPVSAAFLAKVGGNNTMVTSLVVADPSGPVRVLYPLSGSVTISGTDSVRRTLSASFYDLDGSLTPRYGVELLAPFGNEIAPYRGVVLDDGSTEMVPLGVFVITESTAEAAGAGVTVAVTAQDRSARLMAALSEAISFESGTDLGSVILTVLGNSWPSSWGALPVSQVRSTYTTPALTIATGDVPWTWCRDLAQSYGYDLYFDADGNLRMAQWVDPSGVDPTLTYTYGDESVILTEKAVVNSADVYNGVIVLGEGTEWTAPVRGEAWEDNLASPTNPSGKFGRRPAVVTVAGLYDPVSANQVAASLLASTIGAGADVDWTQLVNPALDVNDTIDVADFGPHPHARFVLDQLTVPLGEGEAMAATARWSPLPLAVGGTGGGGEPPPPPAGVFDSTQLYDTSETYDG
jgi:hypothetical protein